MQIRDMAGEGRYSIPPESVPLLGFAGRRDPLLLIGVPLLLLTGAALGLIHVLAWISLVAVLLGS